MKHTKFAERDHVLRIRTESPARALRLLWTMVASTGADAESLQVRPAGKGLYIVRAELTDAAPPDLRAIASAHFFRSLAPARHHSPKDANFAACGTNRRACLREVLEIVHENGLEIDRLSVVREGASVRAGGWLVFDEDDLPLICAVSEQCERRMIGGLNVRIEPLAVAFARTEPGREGPAYDLAA